MRWWTRYEQYLARSPLHAVIFGWPVLLLYLTPITVPVELGRRLILGHW